VKVLILRLLQLPVIPDLICPKFLFSPLFLNTANIFFLLGLKKNEVSYVY
jgi:hypothetical protein